MQVCFIGLRLRLAVGRGCGQRIDDGLAQGFRIGGRNQADTWRPHAVLAGDYCRAQVKRFAHGDGVAVVKSRAQKHAALLDRPQGARVGNISAQQDVFCIRLDADKGGELRFETACAHDRQTGMWI